MPTASPSDRARDADPAEEASALYRAGGFLLLLGFLGIMVLAAAIPLFDEFVIRVVVASAVASGVFAGALVGVLGTLGGVAALVWGVLAGRRAPEQ